MALEIQVSNLTPLISFATRAAAATQEDLAELEAGLDALSDRVDYLYETIAGLQPASLIIISHGQSLAMYTTPRVTVGVTIANYFMPAGGIDVDFFPNFTTNSDHLQKSSNFDTFVAFQEPSAGESWGSGLGYQFRRNPDTGPMTFFQPADGARHWRELKPGTGRWGNLVQYVLRAHERFYQSGELNVQVRLFWTHIEAECDTIPPGGVATETVITAEETQAIQEELLSGYHHDMSLVFGRDMSHLPIYITPLNSAHYDDVLLAAPHPRAGSASRLAQAGQLAACQDNPKLVLLPPHYQFYLLMSGDGVHILGQGRRYHAELCASVAERVEAGGSYMAPHVVSATRSGAVITAACHFPGGGGGVRDTTTFGDPTTHWADQKYGVQYWHDATAAFVTVSDATISGSTMTVTLASNPGAGAGELRIAQLPWTTTATAPVTWTARSNFRDAVLNEIAQDGTVLYHYMVPQTMRISA